LKITAVITTYNSAKYIRRTINSILNQDKRGKDFELEIIIVDDKSTDETAKIVQEEYRDIKFIQNETNSGGPNKGRNIGLNMATGDYICIVDHDDEWLPDKITEQLNYLKDGNLIVTSNYLLADAQNNKEVERGNKSETEYTNHKTNETFFNKLAKNKKGEKAYIGSILFHKSLKTNYFEEKYGMADFDWLLRLFKNNSSIEINIPLYRRHFYGSNLSLDENYRKNDYDYSMSVLLSYQQEFPKIVPRSIKRLNGSMARYYYLVGKMKQSRYYFRRSELTSKTILYYLTSFVGSGFVKKHFHIFG
jgi:glycosyltransferase involved in cell wall biosynthesis